MLVTEDVPQTIKWPEWSDNPYPLYRLLRDRSPVYYDAQDKAYLVTRYDDVMKVLLDAQTFSSIPLATLHADPNDRISPLREADAPRHTWLRQIVAPLFTAKAMRNLEDYFVGVSGELLDAVDGAEVVEVSSQLAIPLPGRVTCDLLGVPLDHHKRFMDLTAERLNLLHVQGGRILAFEGMRNLDEIRADLWAIVEPIIAVRKVAPQNDAITLLLNAQERVGRQELPDALFIDMLLHLLTGGFHTTQHLVEMIMSLMADRDDLWQRLRADRTLVEPVIEEMLRWDPPVQAMTRRVTADTEIAGVAIPAGSEVKLVYGAANRDERAFEDPDTYRLDRVTNRHIAFSAGVHFCPGSPVTRFEVRALLKAMLDRYERVERAGPSVRWATVQRNVNAMHGYQSVPVRLIRH